MKTKRKWEDRIEKGTKLEPLNWLSMKAWITHQLKSKRDVLCFKEKNVFVKVKKNQNYHNSFTKLLEKHYKITW